MTYSLTEALLILCLAGGDLVGRQVVFANGQVGVVVAHRPPMVFVYSDMDEFDSGDGPVKVLDSLASVAVSNNSDALDCFGRTLDDSSVLPKATTMERPIFAPIPQVKDIALINSPVVSGVTMVDALSPIGLGQNMLLVGHDINDMRRYACDILSMQSSDTKCIYAATSNREEVEQALSDAGLLEDITLVAQQQTKSEKSKESNAAEAISIAAAACAMGEAHAIEEGKDSLIIVDTIDHHKQLWDATTRVLVDVFGAEAVVKGDREGAASSEMRSFYSSLIQRSAQYNKKRGGGSVTLLLMTTIPKMAGNQDETVFSPEDFEDGSAKVQERIQLLVAKNIPLTAANLRKIDIPIPSDSEGVRRMALQHVDDLISMSDGQIWLDERLEQAGRQPPMDPQRSITRIGIGADTESRADAPALRRIVEGLRLDLAQAASMDGADTATNASVKQIRRSNALLLAMHQKSGAKGRKLSESCVVLLAATKGHLDSTVDNGILPGTDEGDAVIGNLLEHVASGAPSAMADVDASQDMSENSLLEMEEAIKSFFEISTNR